MRSASSSVHGVELFLQVPERGLLRQTADTGGGRREGASGMASSLGEERRRPLRHSRRRMGEDADSSDAEGGRGRRRARLPGRRRGEDAPAAAQARMQLAKKWMEWMKER